MNELLRRLGYLWNRRRLEREMAEEMAYHRELMAPDRRPGFGSDLRLRDDVREIWGWVWLDRLRQDLGYGARVLRNSPGFTLTAMLVLALGTGVPLTVFRVALAGLRGASVPDPDTLVRLTRRAPGVSITSLPYPQLAFYTAHASSFRQVIGVSEHHQAVFGEVVAGDAPVQIQLGFATSNYFPEFGISPVRGRLFTPADERPEADPVALVSEPFWRLRLGGASDIVGRNVRIDGKLVSVIGVLSRAGKTRADVWMPLVRQPDVLAGSTLLTDWNSALDVFARLNSGVSPMAAQQETRALAAMLRALQPEHVRPGEYLDVRPILQFDSDSDEWQIALTAWALVMMLLVAACTNLGTLVLARGLTREREIQIRMALGAGRRRVVRQLFTESLLLASLSALCGLSLSTIVLTLAPWNRGLEISLLPDWRVLAATFGVALLSALVFGLQPALRLTSLVPRGGRARTIFLAVQVAASCLLLTLSSLMVGAVQRLNASDPGFDYRHLVWVSSGLKAHGYGGPAAQAYLDLLRARAIALPDVKAVSQVWLPPWGDLHMWANWAGRQFAGNQVDAGFLNAMRIQLVRGRNFLPGEQRVAIVNEATERVLWPDSDAIGKPLPWGSSGVVVVGVVRNASSAAVGNPEPLEFYLPLSQSVAPESGFLVRVSGRPHDSLRSLRDASRSLDPRLQPVVLALTDTYDREVGNVTLALGAIATLGIVAILLSAIGLAGVAGYAVAQRTREIGLRIALGANAGQIAKAILAPMGRPIVIGFVCGALGGSAAAQVLRSGLPSMARLRVFDPMAYFMVMAFFAVVLSLAILKPSRRAIRIDPGKALRH
ncbi:MAG: ABC transporter permease [Bryobacterales bacterium]|nr:ABC transporter permease [Bryobacterales bacterium]